MSAGEVATILVPILVAVIGAAATVFVSQRKAVVENRRDHAKAANSTDELTGVVREMGADLGHRIDQVGNRLDRHLEHHHEGEDE